MGNTMLFCRLERPCFVLRQLGKILLRSLGLINLEVSLFDLDLSSWDSKWVFMILFQWALMFFLKPLPKNLKAHMTFFEKKLSLDTSMFVHLKAANLTCLVSNKRSGNLLQSQLEDTTIQDLNLPLKFTPLFQFTCDMRQTRSNFQTELQILTSQTWKHIHKKRETTCHGPSLLTKSMIREIKESKDATMEWEEIEMSIMKISQKRGKKQLTPLISLTKTKVFN